MTITLRTPTPSEVVAISDTLATWQIDDGPLQLHPGDLGWASGKGMDVLASNLRVWSDESGDLAIGLLDGSDVLRLAINPAARDNEELAQQIADAVNDPASGVLPAGEVAVEARGMDLLTSSLRSRGWVDDEVWVPFSMPQNEPVEVVGLEVRVVDLEGAADFVRVHWSAFKEREPSAEEFATAVERIRTILSSPLSDRSRCLVGFDEAETPVAVAMVWSAGNGRPGLLEPMGVRHDQRGHGYGRAITRAAAAALFDMGASSAIVCTDSPRVGAIATYVSAGFTRGADFADLRRPAE